MNKLYCTAEFQNVMQKTEAKKSPYDRYVNIAYKSRQSQQHVYVCTMGFPS